MDLISIEDMMGLPEPVVRHLKWAGVLGTPKIKSVYLEQTGFFKKAPEDSHCLPMSAWQTFELEHPSFFWKAKMKMSFLLYVSGYDKLKNGKGLLKMYFMGIFPVVSANGAEVDQGELVRYLSETIWFPQVYLNKDLISWEQIDENRARATLHAPNMTVSGVFEYHDNGEFKTFEAERYYIGKESTTLEKWIAKANHCEERGGLNIPTHGSVVWKLEQGDYEYCTVNITKIKYE